MPHTYAAHWHERQRALPKARRVAERRAIGAQEVRARAARFQFHDTMGYHAK